MPQDARAGNPATRFFADRKVGTKILIAVSSTALVACGVGALSISKLGSVDKAASSVYEDSLLPVADLSVLRRATVLTRLDTANAVISQTAAGVEKSKAAVTQDDEDLGAAVAAYEAKAVDPELLAEFKSTWIAYQEVRDGKLLPAAVRHDVETFSKVRDAEGKPLTDKATELLGAMFDKEQARAKATAAEAHSTFTAARTLVLAALLVGLLLGLGLALFVSGLVTKPLKKVSEVLKGMAQGDLTQSVDVDSKDEVGQMAGDLRVAMETVRTAVQAMARNSQALSGSSEELSSVSTTIAASAEQASAQANVVSAAAEQVS
ncbi:MAG: Methyl-accepting chemotaxis protein mcpB, partial [Frankiales bacterium]|nr:Methyl-accepting chemotaxis protein mcpB [Frankiales bacterium]